MSSEYYDSYNDDDVYNPRQYSPNDQPSTQEDLDAAEELRRRLNRYGQPAIRLDGVKDQPAQAGLSGASSQATGIGDEIYKPNYRTVRSNPLGFARGRQSLLGLGAGMYQQKTDEDIRYNEMEEQKFRDSVAAARYKDANERTKSLELLREQRRTQGEKPKFTGEYEILNVPGMERGDGETMEAWQARIAKARKDMGFVKEPNQPSVAADVQDLEWYAKNRNNPDPNVQAAVKMFERWKKNQGQQWSPGAGHQVLTDESGTWDVDLTNDTRKRIKDADTGAPAPVMEKPGSGKKGNGNPPKQTDRLTVADVEKQALAAGNKAFADTLKATGGDQAAASKAAAAASAQAKSLGLPSTLGPNPDRFPTSQPPAQQAGQSAAPKQLTKKQVSPSTGMTRTLISNDGGKTWQVKTNG